MYNCSWIHCTLKNGRNLLNSDQRKSFLFIVLIILLFSYFPGFGEIHENLRVISLAPHITEIIYKLDADSCLIGRTDFCSYPSEANQVESVGGYLNIDFEKVVRLEPDLIMQFPNPENRRKLEGLGFKVLAITNETIDEILNGIKEIGEALQKIPEAQKLCDNIRDTLNMASKIARKPSIPVPAILVVGRDRGVLGNIYLAGSNTYLSELWELCGGTNVFNDINMRYFSVNEEDLLKRDIKVILEFHPGWSSGEKSMRTEKKAWSLLNHLTAVERDNIYIYTDRFYVIPGPRITQVAISFMEIIQNYNSNQ